MPQNLRTIKVSPEDIFEYVGLCINQPANLRVDSLTFRNLRQFFTQVGDSKYTRILSNVGEGIDMPICRDVEE